jgi:hypothetical protein
VMRNEEGVCRMVAAGLDGKPRNHRGSSPPSRAALGPAGPSSATLPARGRVDTGEMGNVESQTQAPTFPLAGEVAQLGPQDRSAARRGGAPRSNADEDRRQ